MYVFESSNVEGGWFRWGERFISAHRTWRGGGRRGLGGGRGEVEGRMLFVWWGVLWGGGGGGFVGWGFCSG